MFWKMTYLDTSKKYDRLISFYKIFNLFFSFDCIARLQIKYVNKMFGWDNIWSFEHIN